MFGKKKQKIAEALKTAEQLQEPVEKQVAEIKNQSTEIEEMLAKGYVPAVVDKLHILDAQAGDFLVFQFRNMLGRDKMDNLTRNFTAYLRTNKLRGIFLPPDIDLKVVLRSPEGMMHPLTDEEKQEAQKQNEFIAAELDRVRKDFMAASAEKKPEPGETDVTTRN